MIHQKKKTDDKKVHRINIISKHKRMKHNFASDLNYFLDLGIAMMAKVTISQRSKETFLPNHKIRKR